MGLVRAPLKGYLLRRIYINIHGKKYYTNKFGNIDWDFTGETADNGLSSFHWYPARYMPQLPGILINYFSKPRDIVLDPFVGSGTTLVEAYKFGRKGLGIDINPIAVIITRAKLSDVKKSGFAKYTKTLLSEAQAIIDTEIGLFTSQRTIINVPNYDDNKLWYHRKTLLELSALWSAIRNRGNSRYYDISRVVFSSILRYCCSQDKHWGWICDNVKPKITIYKPALSLFNSKIIEFGALAERLRREASDLQEAEIPITDIETREGDCVEILSEYREDTFDLIVTSPPYYNMTDYILSQRLTNLWFEFEVEAIRPKEIGARFKRKRVDSIEDYLVSI